MSALPKRRCEPDEKNPHGCPRTGVTAYTACVGTGSVGRHGSGWSPKARAVADLRGTTNLPQLPDRPDRTRAVQNCIVVLPESRSRIRAESTDVPIPHSKSRLPVHNTLHTCPSVQSQDHFTPDQSQSDCATSAMIILFTGLGTGLGTGSARGLAAESPLPSLAAESPSRRGPALPVAPGTAAASQVQEQL